MNIKKDSYREQQVRTMLKHETNENEIHYGGNLSHWAGDSKPIIVEADALDLLADAYAGKYIEVNDQNQDCNMPKFSFWHHYNRADRRFMLLFVKLPHLNNRDIVNLLAKFDILYGDTDQDTTKWALEFQVLTRMLVHHKCLLVNPLFLDISDEDILLSLTSGMADEDKEEYLNARKLNQDEIWQMYQKSKK